MTDEDLAAELAEGAGRLLMTLRGTDFPREGRIGVVADKVANAFIMTSLRQWRPNDPILSEESPDRSERLDSRRVWIIDPLDGTREYVEGRSDWAVHVALAIDGIPRIGAVALPAMGQLFRSDQARRPVPGREQPVMVVSRTRPPEEAASIASVLGAKIVTLGSAGAKAMAVVSGDADIYYHSGGQHEWDSCAPAAVAIGAGLHASRTDGSPLVYNNSSTLLPDLLIAPADLARRIIACGPAAQSGAVR